MKRKVILRTCVEDVKRSEEKYITYLCRRCKKRKVILRTCVEDV